MSVSADFLRDRRSHHTGKGIKYILPCGSRLVVFQLFPYLRRFFRFLMRHGWNVAYCLGQGANLTCVDHTGLTPVRFLLRPSPRHIEPLSPSSVPPTPSLPSSSLTCSVPPSGNSASTLLANSSDAGVFFDWNSSSSLVKVSLFR